MVVALGGCGPPARPPSVVVVALDGVRPDRTGLVRADRPTPALSALAAAPGAVWFSDARAAASWSAPAYPAIFSGTWPLASGAQLRQSAFVHGERTLAEVFAAHGYRTAAFTAGGTLGTDQPGAQGFETVAHALAWGSIGLRVDDALAWLDAQPPAAPVFLFVHGYDAHMPYLTAPAVAELYDPDYDGVVHDAGLLDTERIQHIAGGRAGDTPLGPADLDHVRAHYDASVRVADLHLGRLLAGLRTRGRLDDALVVVLSDHGEALGEGPEGRFGHGDAMRSPEVFQSLALVRLPCGDRPPETWTAPVSTIDLAPSLLAWLGMTLPAVRDGAPLWTLDPERPCESTVLQGRPGPVFGVSPAALAVSDATAWVSAPVDAEGPHDWTAHDPTGQPLALSTPAVQSLLAAVPADWRTGPIEAPAQLHADQPQIVDALRRGGYWRAGDPDHAPSSAPPAPGGAPAAGAGRPAGLPPGHTPPGARGLPAARPGGEPPPPARPGP